MPIVAEDMVDKIKREKIREQQELTRGVYTESKENLISLWIYILPYCNTIYDLTAVYNDVIDGILALKGAALIEVYSHHLSHPHSHIINFGVRS